MMCKLCAGWTGLFVFYTSQLGKLKRHQLMFEGPDLFLNFKEVFLFGFYEEAMCSYCHCFS